MFCDFFKGEIITKFDENEQSDIIDELTEKFDDFKEKCNINFIRWLNKLLYMQRQQNETTDEVKVEDEDDDLFAGVNKKKWMSI